MIYKAIAAVANNGVIGNGLQIPWRISEDFKHFKRTTMGGIILMGRRTWDSLGGKPLPSRENVVITSRPQDVIEAGAKAFASLEDFEKAYAGDARTVWVCGGAALYKSALKKCDELIMSKVNLNPEGDIFFPDISADFIEKEILETYPDFSVVRYVRK